MKYMFASDIHGSAYYCRKMLEAFEAEGASRLFLLGDLLYHGPRNDLPKEYAPKQVIAMLNEKKQYLTNVRGNCDAEVDQMVLEFPVLADYGILIEGGHTFYMSHGHISHDRLPVRHSSKPTPAAASAVAIWCARDSFSPNTTRPASTSVSGSKK